VTTATFVKSDPTTAGNWKGVYGTQGYSMAGSGASLPPYATLTASAPQWIWQVQTPSVSGLLLPSSSDRIAACWYSFTQLQFDLNTSDSKLHRVSIYFWDASNSGRQQRVELVDRNKGAILDSRLLTNFGSGVYLTWEVTGNVTVRITPNNVNAVASGIFLD